MNPFIKSLLTAREALLSDFAQQVAQAQQQLSQLDALLSQYDVPASSLPVLSIVDAPPAKKRGRPAGSTNKTEKAEKADKSEAAPKEKTKASGAKKKGKPGRKPKVAGEKSFNTTQAVRDIVHDIKQPFSVGDVREEFAKRHPGMLESINRVALSLALQSMGRRGEITAKKNPNSKGNLFHVAK